MSTRERIPDEIRAQIEQAIRDGGTCRGVARQFEVSPGTVRNIAKSAGITDAFARASTENATRARVTDLAARRAQLAVRMLDLAETIADRATASYTYYVATKEDVIPVTLSAPPLAEVRQAMTAVGIAVDKHMALIRFDTKEGGSNAATSLVDRLAAALHLDGPAPDGYDDGYPEPLTDGTVTDPTAEP